MYGSASATSERGIDLSDMTIPPTLSNLGRQTALWPRHVTLSNPINCCGIGLHSGRKVKMSLIPAKPGFGICFRRTDLPDRPLIPALYDAVVETRLSTVIGLPDRPGVRVATIEHLMAALHANHVTDVCVELDGPETPVFDGSSSAFDFLISCAGRRDLGAASPIISVSRVVRVTGPNGAFAELRPQSGAFSLSVSIDFRAEAIGFQHRDITLSESTFRKDICDSRTFIDMREIEALQAAGLAKGGSLDNAVVVDGANILNRGGFRHPDECARHKILDAIGDIYLAGGLIEGQFVGFKCGHDINNRLLHALFADVRNWQVLSPQPEVDTPLDAVA